MNTQRWASAVLLASLLNPAVIQAELTVTLLDNPLSLPTLNPLLTPTYTSEVTLAISGAEADTTAWRLEVKQHNIYWAIDLPVEILLTTASQPETLLSSQPLVLTPHYQALVYGTGNQSYLRLRITIPGFTLQVRPGTYSLNLLYRITGLTPESAVQTQPLFQPLLDFNRRGLIQ